MKYSIIFLVLIQRYVYASSTPTNVTFPPIIIKTNSPTHTATNSPTDHSWPSPSPTPPPPPTMPPTNFPDICNPSNTSIICNKENYLNLIRYGLSRYDTALDKAIYLNSYYSSFYNSASFSYFNWGGYKWLRLAIDAQEWTVAHQIIDEFYSGSYPGSSVDGNDIFSDSVLHVASQYENATSIVIKLLRNGASITRKCYFGASPLCNKHADQVAREANLTALADFLSEYMYGGVLMKRKVSNSCIETSQSPLAKEFVTSEKIFHVNNSELCNPLYLNESTFNENWNAFLHALMLSESVHFDLTSYWDVTQQKGYNMHRMGSKYVVFENDAVAKCKMMCTLSSKCMSYTIEYGKILTNNSKQYKCKLWPFTSKTFPTQCLLLDNHGYETYQYNENPDVNSTTNEHVYKMDSLYSQLYELDPDDPQNLHNCFEITDLEFFDDIYHSQIQDIFHHNDTYMMHMLNANSIERNVLPDLAKAYLQLVDEVKLNDTRFQNDVSRNPIVFNKNLHTLRNDEEAMRAIRLMNNLMLDKEKPSSDFYVVVDGGLLPGSDEAIIVRESGTCYIVFKESETSFSQTSDWTNNVNALSYQSLKSINSIQIPYCYYKEPRTPITCELRDSFLSIEGRVVTGIAQTYEKMKFEIYNRMKSHCNDVDTYMYAGYSRGGSLAQAFVFAHEANFKNYNPLANVKIVTLGATRTLHKDTAIPLQKKLQKSYRVMYGNDCVTYLPPTWLGQRHLGDTPISLTNSYSGDQPGEDQAGDSFFCSIPDHAKYFNYGNGLLNDITGQNAELEKSRCGTFLGCNQQSVEQNLFTSTSVQFCKSPRIAHKAQCGTICSDERSFPTSFTPITLIEDNNNVIDNIPCDFCQISYNPQYPLFMSQCMYGRTNSPTSFTTTNSPTSITTNSPTSITTNSPTMITTPSPTSTQIIVYDIYDQNMNLESELDFLLKCSQLVANIECSDVKQEPYGFVVYLKGNSQDLMTLIKDMVDNNFNPFSTNSHVIFPLLTSDKITALQLPTKAPTTPNTSMTNEEIIGIVLISATFIVLFVFLYFNFFKF